MGGALRLALKQSWGEAREQLRTQPLQYISPLNRDLAAGAELEDLNSSCFVIHPSAFGPSHQAQITFCIYQSSLVLDICHYHGSVHHVSFSLPLSFVKGPAFSIFLTDEYDHNRHSVKV